MLKTQIIGNLGADAHVVTSNSGRFVSMNVAHTRKYRKADGTPCEETLWVNVVINWDASKIMPYLLKGAKIYAQGNTRLRVFKDRQGIYCAGMDLVADTIELCGSKQPDTTTPTPQSFVDTSTGEVINSQSTDNCPY